MVSGVGRAGESVAEAGAVVNVGGSVGPPGERDVASEIQGVALVVIEGKEWAGWRKVRQTAGDG